jgi:hypothetical protein
MYYSRDFCSKIIDGKIGVKKYYKFMTSAEMGGRATELQFE